MKYSNTCAAFLVNMCNDSRVILLFTNTLSKIFLKNAVTPELISPDVVPVDKDMEKINIVISIVMIKLMYFFSMLSTLIAIILISIFTVFS